MTNSEIHEGDLAGGDKANWTRVLPKPPIERESIDSMIAIALPGNRVVNAELLSGGLSNSNFKIDLASGAEPILLRVYQRDPAACAKEVAIHNLVGPLVPVPKVLYSETRDSGAGPFVVMEFVDGITFRDLKATRDIEALGQASYSIGQVLKAIGIHQLPAVSTQQNSPPEPDSSINGEDYILRFVDTLLESSDLRGRINDDLRGRIHDFTVMWGPRFTELQNEQRLVHCDFNSPNILVRKTNGRWIVAAILDWEFAISGSPLFDIGNFLRYERQARPMREPWFSNGYLDAGASLPGDWRELARAIDLSALCEIISRPALPQFVITEVSELILATVENRDPIL